MTSEGPSGASPALEGIPPWRACLADGNSLTYAEVTATLFEVAVRPSCQDLATKLAQAPKGDDNAAIDYREGLGVAQLELHKSFALALNGLWERNFREHLAASAGAMGFDNAIVLDIQMKPWEGLLKQFKKVRGFSLDRFSSYPTLALLHQIGNAARHGNGFAAEKLYGAHPELFLKADLTSGWFSYFVFGGEPAHSVRRLNITIEQLELFKDAILAFWLSVSKLQAGAAEY